MKKLKGLKNRAYNAMFHTHTVAGIVISFALFVIFYAGAFSLFRHEIVQWENPDMRQPLVEDIDLDAALAQVDSAYHLNFHEITNVNLPNEKNPVLSVYGAYNDTDSTTARMAAYISPKDMRIQDINEPKTTVGTTIYYLHYFRHIPVVGLYISGLIALFFLFASITGILIHWRNLLTKFYSFVTEGKWKNIWTNAHTVLGVIGLPFQIMYAVTGAFFGLLVLILLPSVFLLYDGDTEKVFAKVQPQQAIQFDKNAPLAQNISLNILAEQIKEAYPDHDIQRAQLRNYGREDAVVTWQIDDEKGINAPGTLSMKMRDGIIMEEYSVLPYNKAYSNAVTDYIFKLHFATFGGTPVKILYFILSMITCFMVISGVLIWRTARDNKRYTLKQRLFHHRVTKWYLARKRIAKAGNKLRQIAKY
ncbi:MAG: PepSY-associated TM helix domain-containing protein, partial [Bacteroidota bacterium]